MLLMQNLKKHLFQKIYPKDLETINGIKFTWREIDIVAFMVHGKSTKKIASFLSISPRTVENHVRNIMMKIECNSREAIVDFVEKSIEEGKDIALEIEVKGAMQIKKKIKDAILIFILPPSIEELKSRLIRRNTESREVIERRLSIVDSEFAAIKEFDYNIVNDNLNEALQKLESVIIAERCKVK